ncbi:hypothetical protein COEREDRAFT_8824 [Coemansia reversa NRRL 1564]|uniref:Deoxyuridine 5'-triphosphate nucleotidohydrolase n=1 Tax=Coemansia reversa (strain ATCC 12441 / NRRL 1564) TaxID=763665 RepID=A0A2G5BA08_COERN|nr:hypothetical protein COEREDRAFT_8824 [Coemansia reversa NRRL 1564]|eukprot:PIA15856.1 hypothetical protein COEREDRAFT_8824 [Coemansia reversa NRRL 1564]
MVKPETPTSTPPHTDDPTTPELKIAELSTELARQHKSPITPASSATPAAHDMDELTEALNRWSLSMLTVLQLESNSLKPIDIAPKTQVTVPLGITAKVPKGTFLQLAPCSGLAKKGVALLGGIVDAGYHGEIKVILLNTGSAMVSLACSDRVA